MIRKIKFFLLNIFLASWVNHFCLAQNSVNPFLGPNVRAMAAQALAAEKRGDLASAIDINKKILETQPANVCSINSIAGLYGKLGQYDDEMQWAEKAIAIDKNYSLAYINYGDALAGKGRVEEAKQAYQTASTLNPKLAIPLYNLGVLSDRQHDYVTAIQFYQKAIILNPNFEDAYYNLGVDYINLKKFPEAISAFQKVLSLNPNAADANKILKDLKQKAKKEKK
ncbi:MAG: repeat-containing protein [Gammaproteobacteria bacterium]|jgi:superkiller protein 3|nr:repeat-containing protein [Gammaproteobacteria bacterium]